MKMKTKNKRIRGQNWICDVQYTTIEKSELLDKLTKRKKYAEDWIELLIQKRELEKQLSSVKCKVLNVCIASERKAIRECISKIKKLKK